MRGMWWWQYSWIGKKTFDTVNHEILLNKLKTFNFSDEAIAWFHTYLKHREQWVSVEDQT